jgi:hypothetical protein
MQQRPDFIFLRFFFGLLVVLLLYGLGMMAVIFFANEAIGLRMLSGFASMFSGLLGLGSGYLLGRNRE